MLLSFNIPTYNRASFLARALDKIAGQVSYNNLEREIEINISDNASEDNTKEVVEQCVKKHPSVKITYKRNDKNIGPDKNFLSAMHMATGEYSVLWGDDDYLKDGGLDRILGLIDIGKKNDTSLLVSSTSVISPSGDEMYENKLLREDINDILVDFSDIHQVREYLFLVRSMAGLLSFISSVVYRTSIIKEVQYNDGFTGTHYAFLSYWWGWLSRGNKLYISNYSYINASEQYQAAYGYGVKREMVDYDGFRLIADSLLCKTQFRQDFMDAFMNLHPILYRQMLGIRERKLYVDYMVKSQAEFGVTEKEQRWILQTSTLSYNVKNVLYLLMPVKMIMWLKNKKRR